VRPLRLEIEGFTSFKEKVELDFQGLDLFAITGATGAGKSSLIDAIVFALYGQVPRVGDDYKQLISHGAERLSVLFEFAVGDERYRIARVARRSGPSQQRLEQLGEGDPEPLADRVREMRARVEEILGLDYDGFTRSVVLPQGQFDAFLKGEPKERRKILVALLRLGVYDDMLKVANQRGAVARQEVAFITQSLERDFAGATENCRQALAADLAVAEAEQERVQATLLALEEGLSQARRVRAARQEVVSLGQDIAVEESKRQAAADLLAGGDETKAALEREIEQIETRIVATGEDGERQTTLAAARPRAEELVLLRRSLERLERSRGEVESALAEARSHVAAATGEIEAARAAREEADAALSAARTQRDDAHRVHAALALRRDLRPGEPCPVCEQKVKSVRGGIEPALDAVEERVRDAEGRLGAGQQREQEARVALEKSRAREEAKAGELAQLAERREESASRASSCESSLEEAGYPASEHADAAALVARIGAELEALEAARRRRAELEKDRGEAQQRLAGLEARLAAAAAERDGAAARAETLVSRRDAAANQLEEARTALVALAARERWEELGIEDAPAPGRGDEVDRLEAGLGARQRASRDNAARVAALRQQHSQIEEKVARAAELRDRRAALERDAALLKTLADHLKANELVAWIQEEALRRLAVDATAHLSRLSQGRYALRLGAGEAAEVGARAEQDFFVIDRWNTDSVRSVRTLSGGETFLASLALALALAESLASLSAEGRASEALESLFLDEGFGALDGDTLDVVVDALDALHGGERRVGIVTHVRDLAERLPARLEVRKTGTTATAAVV